MSGKARPLKLSVCQLPTGLTLDDPAWADFVRRVDQAKVDLAVLNEMPFGRWIANERKYESELATASIKAHDAALPVLRELPVAVLSSRPIRGASRLCNEAFLLADGAYTPVHHKQYFPQEEGFFEETWYAPERPGFDVIEYRGLRIGVLLCTELMFTEWARHYRRQGAHVIVCPRASGPLMRHWNAAARMAAIISGCYVLSSNRVSHGTQSKQAFGGRGFAYSPIGELLHETSVPSPVIAVDIDMRLIEEAQRGYPCNVRELDSLAS